MATTMKRATRSDLRDFLFEKHMRLIAGPRSGLMVAMLRRIGRERGIMTHIESVAAEFADLFPGDPEHVDLEQDRPRFLVIEGTRERNAVNDDNLPPDPEEAA